MGELKKQSFKFLDVCRPVLLRYVELTQDTLHLAVMDGKDIVVIEKIAGNRQLQMKTYPGFKTEAISTALGMALIAHYPESKWISYINDFSADEPTSMGDLLRELKKAQLSNVSLGIRNYTTLDYSIASSFVANKDLRVACSIDCDIDYFNHERIESLKSIILELAEELAEAVTNNRRINVY